MVSSWCLDRVLIWLDRGGAAGDMSMEDEAGWGGGGGASWGILRGLG